MSSKIMHVTITSASNFTKVLSDNLKSCDQRKWLKLVCHCLCKTEIFTLSSLQSCFTATTTSRAQHLLFPCGPSLVFPRGSSLAVRGGPSLAFPRGPSLAVRGGPYLAVRGGPSLAFPCGSFLAFPCGSFLAVRGGLSLSFLRGFLLAFSRVPRWPFLAIPPR
jgi:hypothetical protein